MEMEFNAFYDETLPLIRNKLDLHHLGVKPVLPNSNGGNHENHQLLTTISLKWQNMANLSGVFS